MSKAAPAGTPALLPRRRCPRGGPPPRRAAWPSPRYRRSRSVYQAAAEAVSVNGCLENRRTASLYHCSRVTDAPPSPTSKTSTPPECAELRAEGRTERKRTTELHLDGLVQQAAVQVAGDEASADALDLVRAGRAARDDWRLCGLHRDDLHQRSKLSICEEIYECSIDTSGVSDVSDAADPVRRVSPAEALEFGVTP